MTKASGVEKRKSILVQVCSFILVTELCERLAYYGLTGSLSIFFRKQFGFSSLLATEINTLFSSVTYITPLLGAYVADACLGRYQTIMAFCIWYLVGLAVCIIGAYPPWLSQSTFMIGLFCGVALGTGGIKPNVVVFGADQFDTTVPEQKSEKDSFFSWFYWVINMGATFSFGVLTNLAVQGIPSWGIPAEYGFFFSFVVPGVIFAIATSVFYSGRNRYNKHVPHGSILTDCYKILSIAGQHSKHGRRWLMVAKMVIPGVLCSIASYFILSEPVHSILAVIGALLVFGCTGFFMLSEVSAMTWLKHAQVDYGGSFSQQQVSDVADVLTLQPYFSFMVMFWAIYGQQNSNFVIQGCQMDLRLHQSSTAGNSSMQISAAMLSVLDSSVILIFIPIFDKLLYPLLRFWNIETTVLRKIGSGFFFCIVSMIVAGVLEMHRKSAKLVPFENSNCASENEVLPMSQVSVLWQSVQYVLIGIAEILASISAYDLFYTEVPESMRSVCQALNLFTTTLGYIVAGTLNSVLSFWIPKDLNGGNLQYVFFVMAFLMTLNLLGFIRRSQSFKYKASHRYCIQSQLDQVHGVVNSDNI